MTVALRYAARSDVGLVRSNNQDSAYAGPHLLMVADGMGGHAAGEVASSVAVSVLSALDEEAPGGDLLDRLSSAVNTANTYLRDMVTCWQQFDWRAQEARMNAVPNCEIWTLIGLENW